METVKEKKKLLRKQMLSKRKKLSSCFVEKASADITQKLFHLEELKRAKTIFAYISFNNEISTYNLIGRLLAQKKTVVVPKMTPEGVMSAVKISSAAQFLKSANGFLYPVNGKIFFGKIDVAIVPGMAFSPRGNRLGRGGGHYDRYSAKNPRTFLIGVGYEWQILRKIPEDIWDQRMHLVVTESRVRRCRLSTNNPQGVK